MERIDESKKKLVFMNEKKKERINTVCESACVGFMFIQPAAGCSSTFDGISKLKHCVHLIEYMRVNQVLNAKFILPRVNGFLQSNSVRSLVCRIVSQNMSLLILLAISCAYGKLVANDSRVSIK